MLTHVACCGVLCCAVWWFVQVLGDLEAARAMLSQGLEQRPACRELWDAALWAEETLPGEAEACQRVGCVVTEKQPTQPVWRVPLSGKSIQ